MALPAFSGKPLPGSKAVATRNNLLRNYFYQMEAWKPNKTRKGFQIPGGCSTESGRISEPQSLQDHGDLLNTTERLLPPPTPFAPVCAGDQDTRTRKTD